MTAERAAFVPFRAPVPVLDDGVHPLLSATCRAAADALNRAWREFDRSALVTELRMGADGTPTYLIDDIVEEAIIEAAEPFGVNILSEELGFVDHGSVLTLAIDPLDGSANAAAGVPLSCFSAALFEDSRPLEALTCWLENGFSISARTDQPVPYRTTGRTCLRGSTLGLLRPKTGSRGDSTPAWLRLTTEAGRVRILSTSCLESMLVALGSIDAFADPGSDTHRLVDLAAAMVVVPAAGGAVIDAFGRPLEFDVDLTRRWSGVVAATPALADRLAEVIRG